MDSHPYFPPEPRRRASDPSLEEMLRRARDTPLDDGMEPIGQPAPRLRPLPSQPQLWRQGAALPSRVVFWIGVMVGALVMYLAIRAQPFAGSAAPQPPAAQYATATATAAPPIPTDTPLPTPTPTDVPTATPVPTVSPPPTDGIVALAKAYYDQQGPFAGSYVLLDATAVQIQSQSDNQLTVCIAYEVATLAAPDTVADTGTRTFTLVAANDGTWQVVQMGGTGSCSVG
ncbi:MAG: hypothetical protein OJF49_001059 [Ktedonobacterales bacterium]|nr:MAG: hypothetical protein OJF49_001059 [Ktedonobacterales bacterium]